MSDTLIILAGGMSSRMKNSHSSTINNDLSEQANNRSKSLITLPNTDRPILDALISNAKEASIKQIILLTGKDNNLFKSYYSNQIVSHLFHDLTISFAVQLIPENRIKPLGTADALLQVVEQYPELKSDSFIVCNSDNLYSTEAITELINSETANVFINYDKNGFKFKTDRASVFAITSLNKNGHLIDIVEKPTENEVQKILDQDGSVHISMNIFKLNGNDIYPFLKNCPINPIRNEKELPTAILNMIKQSDVNIHGINRSEHVPDLTSKDDIVEITGFIQNK